MVHITNILDLEEGCDIILEIKIKSKRMSTHSAKVGRRWRKRRWHGEFGVRATKFNIKLHLAFFLLFNPHDEFQLCFLDSTTDPFWTNNITYYWWFNFNYLGLMINMILFWVFIIVLRAFIYLVSLRMIRKACRGKEVILF